MADEFDFISASDRPALLALCTPEYLEAAKQALTELGYKVHTAATHGDFENRFSQFQYEVVIIEELFAANSLEENETLRLLQSMPMNLRRHATIVLLSQSLQTFHPLQAFQQSVHTIVNVAELPLLHQLLEKAVADNTLFLRRFRDTQARLSTANSG
jgi:hypothetical protein